MERDADALPITEYVQDVSGWEPWQRDYRFGVLLIFPPEPLRSRVNELRARFDPKSQAICDAHISLTVPLPRPLARSEWHELQHVAAALPSLTVGYGPLSNYLPHPGAVLRVEPHDELDRLRASLEATNVFTDAAPRSHPFSAHMTIAEFITVERTEELMHELKDAVPSGEFVCDHVSLAVPDEGFHFDERGRLELGR